MPVHKNRWKILQQGTPKPAELQLAVAPLFLIPEAANLRPYLVSFTLHLLLYLQGKNLEEPQWIAEVDICIENIKYLT